MKNQVAGIAFLYFGNNISKYFIGIKYLHCNNNIFLYAVIRENRWFSLKTRLHSTLSNHINTPIDTVITYGVN